MALGDLVQGGARGPVRPAGVPDRGAAARPSSRPRHLPAAAVAAGAGGALRTFADSVLGPLDRYDEAHGGELIPSLRAFLDRNARWEAAAGELYVHRHTLRYRMRKVEELTGRDLASARDRMELFLAIRARDLLASADWPNASANGAAASDGRPAACRPGPLHRCGIDVGAP